MVWAAAMIATAIFLMIWSDYREFKVEVKAYNRLRSQFKIIIDILFLLIALHGSWVISNNLLNFVTS